MNIGSINVRAFLASRTAKSIPELKDGRVGWHDPDDGIILVAWDLADEVAYGVLIHEAMHAVIYNGGIKLHPDQEVTEEDEELIVNALSAGMFDALMRNNMLVVPDRPALPVRARSPAMTD